MKFSFVVALITCTFAGVAQTVRPYAPELFPENISGAVCGFSSDGNTIYFVREQPALQILSLYQATRNGDRWANEMILPFSGVHSDLGGRLNANGTIFYFTSNRPGGSTNSADVWNIWQVAKTNGGWGEPVPLKHINDKGEECCPVPLANDKLLFSGTRDKNEWQMIISEGATETSVGEATVANAWQWPSYEDVTGKVLFFNSMKRPDTKGMDDIYISRLENGKWSAGHNLGEPVNTKAYEDGAILSPDRKLLIFCRHDTHETPSRVMCVEWTDVH